MAVDPSLTDEAMQSEIDLVEALVIAASHADGPMTQQAVDEALGVDAPDGGVGGVSGAS